MPPKKKEPEAKEPSLKEIIEDVEKIKPAEETPVIAKEPQDYTELELATLKLKHPKLYKEVMEIRRKIARAEKEKNQPPFISGEELDFLERKNPQKYKKLVTELGKRKIAELTKRLNSSTEYPKDTVLEWRMVIRAIERGIWWPPTPKRGAWRPPKRKSNYDRFMQS
jgi:hypothetical protein